jgi:hypothetical protein
MFTKYHSGDQVKKTEMGSAFSTYGESRSEYRENLREGDHLKDPDVDGRIILKWILEKWCGGMDWIDMAQERDRWRALVKVVKHLRFS